MADQKDNISFRAYEAWQKKRAARNALPEGTYEQWKQDRPQAPAASSARDGETAEDTMKRRRMEVLQKRKNDVRAWQDANRIIREREENARQLERQRQAGAGLARYEADRKAAAQAEQEKPWWQKMAEDTVDNEFRLLPGINVHGIARDFEWDTSYQEMDDRWDEEHRQEFGYRYAQDPEDARDYAAEYNDYLNRLEKQQKMEVLGQEAVDKPWRSTAKAIGAQALGGFGEYVNDVAENLGRGRITERGARLSPTEYAGAVTGAISEDLNQKGTIDGSVYEKYRMDDQALRDAGIDPTVHRFATDVLGRQVLDGKGWGDAYQLGTSAAQSMMWAHVAKFGGAAGQLMSMVSYFGQAAASGVDDARARGGSDEQALIYGALMGLAETAAEQIDIRQLNALGNAVDMRELLTNMAKQGISEALEEGVTSVVGTFADELVMQDKSQRNLRILEYMENGMTEEEANRQAWNDAVNDALESVLGGFISGSATGGATTAKNSAITNLRYGNATLDDMVALVQEGMEAPEGSAARTMAQEYEQQLFHGRELNGVQIQRLLQELDAQGYSGTEQALEDSPMAESEAADIREDPAAQEVTEEPVATVRESRMVEDDFAADTDVGDMEEDVLASLSDLGLHEEEARVLRENFRDSGMDPGEYAIGVRTAFQYGQMGIPARELARSDSAAGSLAEYQRITAYKYGRLHGDEKAAQEQAALKNKIPMAQLQNMPAPENLQSGTGVFYDAGGGRVTALGEDQLKELTGKRKAGVEVAILLKKLGFGNNYYFFESYENADGKRVFLDEYGAELAAPNGWYSKGDGSIHIDLNAGADADGLTLYTLSHELTHFVENWSQVKYRQLAEFLAGSHGENGSVDELVTIKQAELSESRNSDVSYEEAYSEFIADSMEGMLADGNVLEKLTEMKKADRGLFDKIREFFSDLVKRITEFYEGVEPNSEEGQAVLKMKDRVEQIQQLFAEALAEADENYRAAAEIGLEVDTETESVAPAVLYSERTWRESDYVQERKKAAAEIHKAIGVPLKKAEAYIDSVNSIAKMIAEDRTRLDYFSSPGRSSFVGNVEYGGSFDFSTLCKKRRLLTGTFTAIQKALPSTALTANEILDIRNRMKEAGLEVSCGLCYVEGSRANIGQFAKEFLRLYKQYYPDAWQPNMADVNTPDGIEWVRINHPECYEQYEYFWNHYGTLKPGDKNLFASQQKPKLYQLHTEYKGEILQKFKDDGNVEDKNLNGGIRLQSFSDFEIVHLIDTMQIVMDMSRVGLAGQAYTKVPDFAWALGDTGLKINLSLIAKGVDADGELIFDDVEGMPIAEAIRLRDRYSKNVGTILVAFNDEQLMAAMADERVDFIIPFHRSQWKKSQYAAMGLPAKTKDYTFMQNEKFIKPQYHEYRGRMVKDKATNYMPNEYWDFSKSGKENAEAYLEMCARNNKRPKFYKLLQNNGDGSYSLKADGSTDGYWKLLIDFKMYDNEGNGSPQTPVRPDFNMKEATRMLSDYRGGHSSFPVAQGIVDEFVEEYKQKHEGRQFSDRKRKGLADSEISVVQNIGRISVNQFNSQHIQATESLAKRYWEDMGVKSPFFRAWFGDWRENDQTPVQTADQKGDTRGVQRNDDTGWDINVSGQVFSETRNHRDSYNMAARPYLPFINDIVKKAILLDSFGVDPSKLKSHNSLLMHSLYAVADIGKGPEVLKLFVEEMNNPNADNTTKRSYQLQNIEKYHPAAKGSQNASPVSAASGTIKTIADLFRHVNLQDSSFNPNSASKVVTADGTPLEMYHGTSTAGFDVFDTYGGNFGLFGKGSYFTDNPEVAESYVRKGKGQEPGVYAVYLNIKRPLDMDARADVAAWKQAFDDADLDSSYLDSITTNEDAFRRLKEVLADEGYIRWEAEDIVTSVIEGMGYDGITHIGGGRYGAKDGPKHRVFIAFEPEQIKSSYDNIGTFDGNNPHIRYQDRSAGTSNRSLLANAFEGVAQNDIERKKVHEYREHVDQLNELERRLQELRAEIRGISFSGGKRDTEKLEQLRKEAAKTARQIDKYDKRLLKLEGAKPLQDVLEREKKAAYQKASAKHQESRKKAMDNRHRSEEKQKIRIMFRELDRILNRGNKKRNVKEGMQEFAASAIASAELLFSDYIADEDLIRNGIGTEMIGKEQETLSKAQDLMEQIGRMSGYDSLKQREKLEQKLKGYLKELNPVFVRERARLNKAGADRVFGDLIRAYEELKESPYSHIQMAYDDGTLALLKSLQADVGSSPVKDMNLAQLEALHKVLTVVTNKIRTANKAFAGGKTMEQTVTQAAEEIRQRKIPDKKMLIAIRNLENKTGWDYEKPVYALKRIGSDAITKLFLNLMDSENTAMADVDECKTFLDQMVEKYGYNDWSVDRKLDRTFVDSTGKKFRMTTGELMSLYAYARRGDGMRHIETGGFTMEHKALTDADAAIAYKLSPDMVDAITDLLTAEQKGFVEEMQTFLSETMGAKGNEVSMKLYGIKLFGEKNYFPIHMSGAYKQNVQEAQAKQAQGFGTLSNAGFTKAQNKNATGVVVMEPFLEVWADHCNEMSRYHATVPALEDIRRVMNYSRTMDSTTDSMSLKALIENRYGKEAVQYLDNLYREANSGPVQDKLQTRGQKALGMFRKNAVAYSSSVLIQQPAAITRAYAMIPKKYFGGLRGIGGLPVGIGKTALDRWGHWQTKAYEEMRRYAPGVTIAKEIGGFDTASGSTIRSYLLDTGKNLRQSVKTEGAKGLAKGTMKLVDDNAVANLPNLMDKIAWIEIWNACKREVAEKRKDLERGSEAFLEAAGQRFTDVIRSTQVYDSVFAKSPLLRSKNVWVQSAVSFMNEPNTAANMMEQAVRDAARGDWTQAGRTFSAVARCVIFTGVLKAVVYALRDDEEDETFLEKYLAELAGSLVADANPVNYIPFARDVWSVAQGYGADRTDMAIFSDILTPLNKWIELRGEDRKDLDEAELEELDQRTTEALWKTLEAGATLIRVPVKNIRREIDMVLRIVDAVWHRQEKKSGTALIIRDKVEEAMAEAMPAFLRPEGKSKGDKLYYAILEGDAVYEERLRKRYEDPKIEDEELRQALADKKADTAIRKALRERDPRIRQAAKSYVRGDLKEYEALAKEVIDEGFFSQNLVRDAIRAEAEEIVDKDPEMPSGKEKGLFTGDDFTAAVLAGDYYMAKRVRDDLIETAKKNGSSAQDAEKNFQSTARSSCKELYLTGQLSDSKAKSLLETYGGKTAEEAQKTVQYWKFSMKYPKYDLNEAAVSKYYNKIEKSGISVAQYAEFLEKLPDRPTKEETLAVINSMKLTGAQKDALYRAAGYAESRLDETPWH